MSEFKVIFVNWTKPYFHKNEADGYNKLKLAELDSKEYDMVSYELKINETAVRCARKFINAPIKLFTDSIGYEFYKKHNLLELFDEIDTDVLDEYNKLNVNAGKFWTSGKSIAIGNQEAPFLFLDNDFIVKSKLPDWVYDYDLVHTHWEIQRGDFFVSHDMVNELGYEIPNFNQNMLMPNTSFVFMNNDELRKAYLKSHLHIVNRKHKKIPEWLWLLTDQGIMGYEARNLNCKVASIEDKIYLSYWESHDLKKACGYTPMWVLLEKEYTENNGPDGFDKELYLKQEKLEYYHVWFDKFMMKTNFKWRLEKLEELDMILKEKYIYDKEIPNDTRRIL